jgi:hypothetical protein
MMGRMPEEMKRQCSVCLVSCSPTRPAAQYRMPPQGPHEQAVAKAFDALVRAYGRQDWGDVMAVIADDARIEPAAPEVTGPSAVDAPGSSPSTSLVRLSIR